MQPINNFHQLCDMTQSYVNIKPGDRSKLQHWLFTGTTAMRVATSNQEEAFGLKDCIHA